jgi:hypothetical protein
VVAVLHAAGSPACHLVVVPSGPSASPSAGQPRCTDGTCCGWQSSAVWHTGMCLTTHQPTCQGLSAHTARAPGDCTDAGTGPLGHSVVSSPCQHCLHQVHHVAQLAQLYNRGLVYAESACCPAQLCHSSGTSPFKLHGCTCGNGLQMLPSGVVCTQLISPAAIVKMCVSDVIMWVNVVCRRNLRRRWWQLVEDAGAAAAERARKAEVQAWKDRGAAVKVSHSAGSVRQAGLNMNLDMHLSTVLCSTGCLSWKKGACLSMSALAKWWLDEGGRHAGQLLMQGIGRWASSCCVQTVLSAERTSVSAATAQWHLSML